MKTVPRLQADGMTLTIDPWYLQVWQGVGNDVLREQPERPHRVARPRPPSTTRTGQSVFTELQSDREGRATPSRTRRPGAITTAYANLYAIGCGKSGMTIDSSATLGTILG